MVTLTCLGLSSRRSVSKKPTSACLLAAWPLASRAGDLAAFAGHNNSSAVGSLQVRQRMLGAVHNPPEGMPGGVADTIRIL